MGIVVGTAAGLHAEFAGGDFVCPEPVRRIPRIARLRVVDLLGVEHYVKPDRLPVAADDGSAMSPGRYQSDTVHDSAEDAQPATPSSDSRRVRSIKHALETGAREMWRRVRSGLASMWSLRCYASGGRE
jgi:hypothetical protein